MIQSYTDALLRNMRWSRRDFLKSASLATLSTLASGFPAPLFASEEKRERLVPSADSVILLWMAGGMAHTETFDPKEPTPFKKGMRYNRLRCTFPSIHTSVDGLKISQGLERVAQIMDRGTLIRSFMPPDLGHILHSRHQYHWHTGYMPPQTIAAPHIGSVVSRILGARNSEIPPFIHIGQRLDIDGNPEVRAFLTPGFLGSDVSPVQIPYPLKARHKMSPPDGMTASRFENRQRFFKKLVANSPEGEFGSGYQRDALLKALEDSHRLITSPHVQAFDLTDEPKESYEQYDTGRFGRGVLLARRLVEAGARFVEVTTEHVPFGNWDTHNNGHERTIQMKKWLDAPLAQLILDLEKKGLLDRTLVIVASEFSRVAVREPERVDPNDPSYIVRKPAQYGMHKHFTKAGSVLLFGGGARRGLVYGRSNDEAPCETVENPVSLSDLHATVYRMLGIPADYSFEVQKRPFYVTENGEGKVIAPLIF